ncbi:DUF1206 domain-containing protein [Agromyces marinus]|nr:DUF1206 domain-containing protein [Agromyces marinus]
MASDSGRSAAGAAQRSSSFRVAARLGYVVLGVVHVVIGSIAITVAQGAGGGADADQGGAMSQLARLPFGVVLLWIIALGLFALAIWQVTEAFLERDPDAKTKWAHRAKYVGTAIAYVSIGATALVYAMGGRSDSSESAQTLSSRLLAAPGGVLVLVLLGLVVIGVGIAFVYRGALRRFEEYLDLPGGVARTGILALGVVGYVAKGVAIGVVGVLFVVASLTHDPERAGGLDGALRSLAELPFGTLVLWIVGGGLIVYGLFCVARARYARL